MAPSGNVPPRSAEVELRAVYLDHNASTPVHPKVAEAMSAYLTGEAGNPSSLHSFGRGAARFRDEARARLAAAAGCRMDEVVFTSGGTEADNLALRGLPVTRGRHLVTVATEHEAVLQTAESLEHAGSPTTVLPVSRAGIVDPDHVAAAIRPDTYLVSIMSANNETGVLQPIREIGEVCRARGVRFHTDAVQLFGKLPFRFADLPVDLVSVSAHKIGGPKGIGALIVRQGIEVSPVLTGGSQERRQRPGTENLPGMVGFGTAAEIALRDMAEEIPRLRDLRDRLERGILRSMPDASVNGSGASRLPNTTNVSFPGLDGESLLVALDLEGIAVSTGAACNAGAAEPSHVLRAMGSSRDEAASSLRFSLGRTTEPSDVDRALEALQRVTARLHGTSAGPHTRE